VGCTAAGARDSMYDAAYIDVDVDGPLVVDG
jgi:hypothetical protein